MARATLPCEGRARATAESRGHRGDQALRAGGSRKVLVAAYGPSTACQRDGTEGPLALRDGAVSRPCPTGRSATLLEVPLRHLPRRLATIGSFVALATASIASPAAAAPAITFEVGQYDLCVNGTAPKGQLVTYSLRDSHGTLRVRSRTHAGRDGSFFLCPFGAVPTYPEPGDTVTVKSPTVSRSIVMPDIWPSIDRVTDVIRGHGPKGAKLRVQVAATSGDVSRTVTVDDAGRWRLDLGGVADILGADPVMVTWKHAGVTIRAVSAAPAVLFSAQSDYVTGVRNLGQAVTLRLTDATGTLRSATPAAAYGPSFLAFLESAKGRAVNPRSGDRLHVGIAGGITLRVPAWNLKADVSAGRVTGRCMPNARYEASAETSFYFDEDSDFDDYIGTQWSGTTGPDGRFSRKMKLKLGVDVELRCRYASGDIFVVGIDTQP